MSLFLVISLTAIALAEDSQVILPEKSNEPIKLALSEKKIGNIKGKENTVFRIYTGSENSCCDDKTPLAGRYIKENDYLLFYPTFGFEPGQPYVLSIQGEENKTLIPFLISNKNNIAEAKVNAVFPSGDLLPENLLRIYIHFSMPMAPHVAYEYIKLYDDKGTADESAFMKFRQEIWNQDRTRLTVLFDPGRIKRDVATNLELGPALVEGRKYSLKVHGGWPSANGKSVLKSFSKTFTVSSGLRERPDIRLWKIINPCLNSEDPLRVIFDRPFDRHLLTGDIAVKDADGRLSDGIFHIGANETEWSFTPKRPWKNREIFLSADINLEDVAGNNFRDLLDHKLISQTEKVSSTSTRIVLGKCDEEI